MELLTLGADLGEFLLKRARSSAANALAYENEIRNIAKKEGVEDVDGLIDELRKVAEDVGSTKFITRGKHLDEFGKLKAVSKYEDEIRKLDYEDAKFFDEEGKVLSESFSQKSKNTVSFGKDDLDSVIKNAGDNPKRVILSHNHPTSTGISAEDIKIVFDKQLGGIRAIAKDGNNYFVKKVGNISTDDFYKTTSNVAKKVRTENPNIVKKAVLDRNSKESKQLAQLLVDGLIEELVKLKEIEYIKYQ